MIETLFRLSLVTTNFGGTAVVLKFTLTPLLVPTEFVAYGVAI